MKTTVLLVRHGHSEANLLKLFAGHKDYVLTELGHEQGKKVAQYLQKIYHVDAVYSSDLSRAFQTAEHIAKALNLTAIADVRFREIHGGDWEDMLHAQIPVQYPDDFFVWKNDIGNSRCTNGESALEVAERVYNALLDVADRHPGQCIVVVTHAVATRTALWKVSGGPVSAMQEIPFGSNCCVNELL